MQHWREERAGGQCVVLAVQEKSNAADAPFFQLRKVVAQAQCRFSHLVARRFGHAGLVLQRTGDRADGQPGRLRDVADGDLAHVPAPVRHSTGESKAWGRPSGEIKGIDSLLCLVY